MRNSKRFARKEAYKNGFRSKFEFDFSKKLSDLGLVAEYEKDKIKYLQPEALKTYTPDWKIKDNIYIETKGVFSIADRKKILNVINSNPSIKFYVLFQDSTKKLNKNSKTTYGMWCEKYGVEWADIRDTKRWRKWFENPST